MGEVSSELSSIVSDSTVAEIEEALANVDTGEGIVMSDTDLLPVVAKSLARVTEQRVMDETLSMNYNGPMTAFQSAN